MLHRHTKDRCALRLRELRAIARAKGGRCLSDAFIARQTRMRFECAQGHQWETTAVIVLHGGWCPECRYRPPASLARMKALARERGGQCLADTYVAARPGMRWRCAKHHEWDAVPGEIRRGSWCPQCAYSERRGLDDMQALAARHGGTCVARQYRGYDTAITWACAEGHRFSVRPRCVRKGQWCPVCMQADTSWPLALALALAKGGTCLTQLRKDTHASALWRCASGHEWTENAHRVARGAWCMRCVGRRLGIEHMRAHAATRSGRCISTEYAGGNTKLLWECEHGHRWWARPAFVRNRGTWCPQCAWDQNAERMRAEAKDRR